LNLLSLQWRKLHLASLSRRGTKVGELITGSLDLPGVPHIAGVRTTSGEEIRADLVVDAMGRRSSAPEWILNVGGRRPIEENEDCNFVYFSRYFSGPRRPSRMGPAVTPMGVFSIITSYADNDTWSITLFPSKNKAMRHCATRQLLIEWLLLAQGKPIGSTASQSRRSL
jgi:hypothetical protein